MRLFAERVGDRQAAVTAERERAHLRPQRILATLPFGAVDETHDGVDRLLVEVRMGEQIGPPFGMFNIGGEHLVENAVFGQRIGVLLPGPQFGARCLDDGIVRDELAAGGTTTSAFGS